MMRCLLFIFFCCAALGPLFGANVFKNAAEAQAEMDKMYAPESDTTTPEDWRNPYTSIVRFMDLLVKHPKEKVFIVYSDDSQLDAVKVLTAFLCRKRGDQNVMASPFHSAIYPVKSSGICLENVKRYRSILLGAPGNIPFLDRMARKGKLSVSSTKAQFRLFARPNCLAISCSKTAMYPELIRVFLRSFPEFDDECYSYFYMN